MAPVPHKERKEPDKKAAEVVVAIYDFFGAEQGDLSLTKVGLNSKGEKAILLLFSLKF